MGIKVLTIFFDKIQLAVVNETLATSAFCVTEVELLDFTRKFIKKHMDKLFQRWALRF